MASTPGYSGLLNAAFPRIGQYEASTGRRIRAPFIQGLLQADLDKAKAFSMQQAQLDKENQFRQQQLDLQMKAEKDTNRAANIGGATNLLGLYGQYKLYDKYLAAKQTPVKTTPTTTTTTPTPGAQTQVQGTDTALLSSPAQTQATATPTDAGLTDAQIAYDVGGDAGAGAGTDTGATSSTTSNIGSGLVAAGLGIAAGTAASYLQSTGEGQRANTFGAGVNKTFGGPNLSNEGFAAGGQGFASGAASGYYLGGPFGALVGGVIGGVIGVGGQAIKEKRIPGVKLFGATVIPDVKTVLCTELHRQGEISDRDLKWAKVFRMRHVEQHIYEGYLAWATPVVGWMQRNRYFNAAFKPVAKAIVRQWVDIARGKKKTVPECILYSIVKATCFISHVLSRKQSRLGVA